MQQLKDLSKLHNKLENIRPIKMITNAKIDALQLMLRDLRTRNEHIRHKAAFRGCQPEFQSLVTKLINQLESELMEEKKIIRDNRVK